MATSSTVARGTSVVHRNSLEDVSPRMAKAVLNEIEKPDFRAEIGRAIQRACSLIGWSQKEAAGRIGRDTAQLARWIAGTERPQFDALFAVEELRWPLIQALAQIDGKNEVVTTIRRTA
jgi:ribosome-binding protein aMBF1 (putative translation factor)